MMKNKALLWGGLFGLVAPFVGLFVGLQVSPMVANVLMFPILGMSAMMQSPFGMWSPTLMLAGLFVSIVAWAFVFVVVSTIYKQMQSR